MLLHRKTLRDAIRACLAAGFNDQLAGLAGVYDVPAFSIDFGDGSTSFWMGNSDVAQAESMHQLDFPAVSIYTGESRDSVPQSLRGLQFAGEVVGCVDVVIRPRDGRELLDAESLLDMADDAVLTLFAAYQWPASNAATIHYKRDSASTKNRLVPLSDGYGQALSISATFGVFIP